MSLNNVKEGTALAKMKNVDFFPLLFINPGCFGVSCSVSMTSVDCPLIRGPEV